MRELTVAMDSSAKTALVYLWAPFANLLWYVETVVMGTISLLVWPFDDSGEMQHACARWWCRMVAVTIGARIQVHGVEQVQAGRSYVYVANHSSLIDTPALFAYLPYQFKIMAKRSLFYVPFIGWHLWSSGNFPIDRGDARKTARSLKSVIDGVRDGKSLMVFPEGTRTPDGSLQEFKHGAFKIAVRARVPVVPVAIRGTFELLPKSTLAPHPGRVDVFICAPMRDVMFVCNTTFAAFPVGSGRAIERLRIIERRRASGCHCSRDVVSRRGHSRADADRMPDTCRNVSAQSLAIELFFARAIGRRKCASRGALRPGPNSAEHADDNRRGAAGSEGHGRHTEGVTAGAAVWHGCLQLA